MYHKERAACVCTTRTYVVAERRQGLFDDGCHLPLAQCRRNNNGSCRPAGVVVDRAPALALHRRWHGFGLLRHGWCTGMLVDHMLKLVTIGVPIDRPAWRSMCLHAACGKRVCTHAWLHACMYRMDAHAQGTIPYSSRRVWVFVRLLPRFCSCAPVVPLYHHYCHPPLPLLYIMTSVLVFSCAL